MFPSREISCSIRILFLILSIHLSLYLVGYRSALLTAELEVLELPAEETATEEGEEVDIEDVSGYDSFDTTNTFSALAHAAKQNVDPFKEINPKHYLASSLSSASKQNPGKVNIIVQLFI